MTDTVEDAGFYAMSTENYHADPALAPSLSHSIAMVLLDRCPAAAWYRHPRLGNHEKPATKKMDLGTTAHMLLTGKGRQLKVLDAESYKKPSVRIERDAARAQGHTPVLADDFRTAEKMVHSLRQQSLYAFDPKYGHCELTGIVKDVAGPWTRCLIDFYGAYWPGEPYVECWDYKTTAGTANPVMLRGHMARMGWALQAAFQERIICQIKPALAGLLKFRFLVQETEEPYLSSVITPSQSTMALAHRMVAAAIAMWHDCLTYDRWPSYSTAPVEITQLPYVEAAWFLREHEEDLVQLALADPWLMASYSILPPDALPSTSPSSSPASAPPPPSPSTSPPTSTSPSSSPPSAPSSAPTSVPTPPPPSPSTFPSSAPAPSPQPTPTPPSPSPSPQAVAKRPPGRPRMTAQERRAAAEKRFAAAKARAEARAAAKAKAAISILPPPEAIAGDELPLDAPPKRLEL